MFRNHLIVELQRLRDQAIAHVQHGDLDAALHDLERAATMAPDDTTISTTLFARSL